VTAGSEDERREEARERAFLKQGFDADAARALARRPDIAYQDAVALLKHGYPPGLVAEMLRSGQRGVF
jgi:hypothetical protein